MKRGAQRAVRGAKKHIKRGAKALGRGLKKGAKALGRGLKKGIEAIGEENMEPEDGENMNAADGTPEEGGNKDNNNARGRGGDSPKIAGVGAANGGASGQGAGKPTKAPSKYVVRTPAPTAVKAMGTATNGAMGSNGTTPAGKGPKGKSPKGKVPHTIGVTRSGAMVLTKVFDGVRGAKKWNAAEFQCKQMGGHLASISSARQNEHVKQVCNKMGKDWACWIGLKRPFLIWTDNS